MPSVSESGGAVVPSSSSLPMFFARRPWGRDPRFVSLGTPELLGLGEGDRALPFFLSLSLANLAGTMDIAASRGRLSLLTRGEPQTMLLGINDRVVVRLAPDLSTEGNDPLALCRDLCEEGDASERELQDNLDRLSTACRKLVVSCGWVAGCRKCSSC